MGEHCDEVHVVVEVFELALDVAVVDVHRRSPQLERGEHALHVFGAVLEVQSDMLSRANTQVGEHVRQAVGPLVELPVREASVRCGQGDAVGHGVGDVSNSSERLKLVTALRRMGRGW